MGKLLLKSVAAAACVCTATSAFATTVYEMNNSAGGNFSYFSGSEYGDEVVLLPGPDRVITGFSFQYYSNYNLDGGLTFKIYKQDGPLITGFASPGTLIDNRTIDIKNNGGTVNIDYGVDFSNVIPDRLTYTVTFGGIGGGNTAGLIAPGGNPVIGLSGTDFWLKTGAGANDWSLEHFNENGIPSANFIATITAVPEPETVALMFAGAGLVLLAARRK